MTQRSRTMHRNSRLTSDHDLQRALAPLLQEAIRRQLWLIFLDADDRIAGPLMPGDGWPDDPDARVTTPDLGETTNAELLAARLTDILAMIGATQVVLVWERCGGTTIEATERAWARSMALACARRDVRVRRQFLLHDRGLRAIGPDDYL